MANRRIAPITMSAMLPPMVIATTFRARFRASSCPGRLGSARLPTRSCFPGKQYAHLLGRTTADLACTPYGWLTALSRFGCTIRVLSAAANPQRLPAHITPDARITPDDAVLHYLPGLCRRSRVISGRDQQFGVIGAAEGSGAGR